MNKIYCLLNLFLLTSLTLGAQNYDQGGKPDQKMMATTCDAVSDFSFDFNDFTTFPEQCWQSNVSHPKISVANNQGDKAIQVYSFMDTNPIYIIMPEVNNMDATHILSFKSKDVTGTQKMKIQFGVLKSNTTYDSFMAIGSEVDLDANTTYTSEAVAAAGDYKFLVIKITPATPHQAAYIDDIEWKVKPCPLATLPYLEDFNSTPNDAIPQCTKVVNAGQGNEWMVKDDWDGRKFLRYDYSSNQADTWFFTKGFNLIQGEKYEISYDYMAKTLEFSEKMKVAIGKDQTVAAMTTVLADHPNITNTDFEKNVVRFTATENGVYYLGFQAYSDPDKFWLSLDNVGIKESPIYIKVQGGGDAVIDQDNGTLQLETDITPSMASSGVTWSIQEGSSLATIDNNGLLTNLNNGNGKVVVRATLNTDTSKYDEKVFYIRVCNAKTVFNTDFNDFTSLPDPAKCWKTSHNAPMFKLGYNGGDKYIEASSWTLASENYYIVSPKVVIDGQNAISFKSKYANGFVKVQVGLLKDNNDYSTFLPIGSSIKLENDTTYSVDIPANSDYHYLAFKLLYSGTHQYVGLDNFTWDKSMAVVDQKEAVEVSVYPNPVVDQLFISDNYKVNTYEVFSLSGKTMLKGQGNVITMRNLPKGVYIVKLRGQGKPIVVKKIIKQ